MLTVALTAGTSCTCSEPRLFDRAPAFVFDPDTVDFPLTQIGSRQTEQVVIRNLTGHSIEVELRAPLPFSSAEASLRLGPAESREFQVRFAPVALGPVKRTLEASGGEHRAFTTLRAIGTESCGPDSACTTFAIDETSGECVGTARPDNVPCQAGACIVDGRCAEGECLGRPLDCDDGNPCTRDLCEPIMGCRSVEDPGICPAPADSCQVATCDPQSGCGTAPLYDGTACGVRDCTEVAVCIQGNCRRVPSPPELAIEPVWARPGMLMGSDEEGNVVLSIYDTNTTLDGDIASVAHDGSLRWTIDRNGYYPIVDAVTEGRLVTRTLANEAWATAVYAAADGRLLWQRPMNDSNWVGGWGERLFFRNRIRAEEPDVRSWTQIEVVDAERGTRVAMLDLREVLSLGGVFDEVGRWYVTSDSGGLLLPEFYSGQVLRVPLDLKRIAPGGAVYDGVLVGAFDGYPYVRTFFVSDTGQLVLGPWTHKHPFASMRAAPADIIGYSGGPAVLIDETSVWMVASAPSCVPSGPHDPCLVESHAYRFERSGELRWVLPIEGKIVVPPILTERGSALLVVVPEEEIRPEARSAHREPGADTVLIELDGDGRTLLRCPLGFPVSGGAVLLDDLLLVSELDLANRKRTLHAIRLPGYHPAPHGWITDLGSFARPFAAQPLTQ